MNRLYEFGPFVLDCRNGMLRRGIQEIHLTAKAFATLLLLVENAGSLVSKQEFLEKIWPEGFIEPANLTQTIYVLRKILGCSSSSGAYIANVPGRGYRFVAPVKEVTDLPKHSPNGFNRENYRPRALFGLGSAVLMTLLAMSLHSSSAPARAKPAISSDAQRYYVMGRHYWSERTSAGLNTGLSYFRLAAKLSPGYAQAYSGIADTYSALSYYNSSRAAQKKDFDLAVLTARKAIAVDPMAAECHASLGYALMQRPKDWPDSNAANEIASEFETAIALDPNYASAHQWYSWFLYSRGDKPGAIAQMRAARDDDPLSPVINFALGYQLFWLHRYDEASAQWHQTISLEPYSEQSYYGAGLVDEQLGRTTTALKEFRKALMLSPKDPDIMGSLAHAYAENQESQAAKRLMSRIIKLRPTPAYSLALINMALGRRDQAVRWLSVAKAVHDSNLNWLEMDPRMTAIQADFKRIMAYKNT